MLDIDYKERFPADYELPKTYTVQTRRGFHHYYLLPDDGKDYRPRSKADHGYDIRANDSYIIAAGSTADGWRYTVINECEMAPAPDWLLEVSLRERVGARQYTPPLLRLIDIEPPDEQQLVKYTDLLSRRVERGQRSEFIWNVLGELVADELTNEEIIALFEEYPGGVGGKYFEKGGGRVSWLDKQIARMRERQERLLVEPFQATNQGWVSALHQDILQTFRDEYQLIVEEDQEEALEQVCNLLMSQLDHERADWYCIPLGVSSGKTEALKHLIKFLFHHDSERKYSLSLSLEKITEIDAIESWLLEKGVSPEYFQVVHHKVPGLAEVFERLPSTPVIIHTHYKLRGTSYLSQYFQYQGEQRDLLIFDESMVSSSVFSDISSSVAKELYGFVHRYQTDPNLREKIPGGIHLYFQKILDGAREAETQLRSGSATGAIEIETDEGLLGLYELPDLIQYANIINQDSDIFRDLLLLGKTDRSLRSIFLQKEEQGAVLFMFRETMSPQIRSLVTTDASREHRTLFNHSETPVKIYNVQNFKSYEKLKIRGVKLSGSKEKIQSAFRSLEKENPYLKYIEEIVRREREEHDKFLIFHSKQIEIAPPLVKIHLMTQGVISTEEIGRRVQFRKRLTNHFYRIM